MGSPHFLKYTAKMNIRISASQKMGIEYPMNERPVKT
jgi:hypothetical protein